MTYNAGNVLETAARAKASRCHPFSSDRAQMMEQLGLHPSTQVDGLMTIFRYASSTSALRPRKLVSLLRAHRENGGQHPGQAAL